MTDQWIGSAAQTQTPTDHRFSGVSVAQVIANCDETQLGRVQVRLTWLPGYQPWARLAVLDQGVYFVPQVDDEVLVAFNHGDVRDVYIVGRLWNKRDKPPAQAPNDPVNKRIIHTPQNHEIIFDDQKGTITIRTGTQQRITVGSASIEIATKDDKAKITLSDSGQITLCSETTLELQAKDIKLNGQSVTVDSQVRTEITGGSLCKIQAAQVRINDPQ
jgi:uncharacterized protein involved in type VI secretion and phage assembly